jgi:hypothetical protein
MQAFFQWLAGLGIGLTVLLNLVPGFIPIDEPSNRLSRVKGNGRAA